MAEREYPVLFILRELDEIAVQSSLLILAILDWRIYVIRNRFNPIDGPCTPKKPDLVILFDGNPPRISWEIPRENLPDIEDLDRMRAERRGALGTRFRESPNDALSSSAPPNKTTPE